MPFWQMPQVSPTPAPSTTRPLSPVGPAAPRGRCRPGWARAGPAPLLLAPLGSRRAGAWPVLARKSGGAGPHVGARPRHGSRGQEAQGSGVAGPGAPPWPRPGSPRLSSGPRRRPPGGAAGSCGGRAVRSRDGAGSGSAPALRRRRWERGRLAVGQRRPGARDAALCCSWQPGRQINAGGRRRVHGRWVCAGVAGRGRNDLHEAQRNQSSLVPRPCLQGLAQKA